MISVNFFLLFFGGGGVKFNGFGVNLVLVLNLDVFKLNFPKQCYTCIMSGLILAILHIHLNIYK